MCVMCQVCGQAPATKRDVRGRRVCGRAAHQVVRQTRKARKEASALARYIKSDPEDKTMLEKARQMLADRFKK